MSENSYFILFSNDRSRYIFLSGTFPQAMFCNDSSLRKQKNKKKIHKGKTNQARKPFLLLSTSVDKRNRQTEPPIC